jgi:hypothetical protein
MAKTGALCQGRTSSVRLDVGGLLLEHVLQERRGHEFDLRVRAQVPLVFYSCADLRSSDMQKSMREGGIVREARKNFGCNNSDGNEHVTTPGARMPR